MDKTLVNHQIVSMRKLVKNAKNHIFRKIFKQINLTRKKLNKWQNDTTVDNDLKQKHLKELQNKLQSKQKDCQELKKIMPDTFSREALMHDEAHFAKLVLDSKTSISDRLIARVCLHRIVQASVKKFRQENPGCEQWLPVQLELWELKRDKKGNDKDNKKNKKNKQSQTDKPKEESKNSIEKPQSIQTKPETTSKNAVGNLDDLIAKMKEKSQKFKQNITPKLKKSPSKSPKSSSASKKSFKPVFQITEMSDDDDDNESNKKNLTPEKRRLSFSEDQHDKKSLSVSQSKVYSPSYVQSGLIGKISIQSSNPAALIKQVDLKTIQSSGKDKIIDDDDDSSNETTPTINNNQKQRTIKDKFFLTGDDDEDDESDDEEEEEKSSPKKSSPISNRNQQQQQKSGKFFSQNSQQVNRGQFNGRNSNQTKFPHKQQQQRFQNNRNINFNKSQQHQSSGFSSPQYNRNQRYFDQQQKSQSVPDQNLHPSWKAKMEAKAKQQISFGSNVDGPKPNKHIKFD